MTVRRKMKLKNFKYIQLLSVIMTLLMLVSFVPATALNDKTEQSVSPTSEKITEGFEQGSNSQTETEQETESFSMEFEVEADKGNSGLGTAGDASSGARAPVVIGDGVYMLENLYYTGYYMSVRSGSLDAGARIIQRQYSSGTPISTFDRQSLFKISKVTGTSRYVIRSMLNNGIGLGVVNGQVVTKELPFDDADVNINDTFTILSTATGCQINPYGNSNSLIAETSVSSDDPAFGGYVVCGSASGVGNRSKWILTKYTGTDRYGFDGTETSDIEDGIIKGAMGTISINSWSTVIGANTPYITIDSAYLSIVDFNWSLLNLQATFDGIKCDDFQINLEIRTGSAQAATHTAVRGYTIIPDVVGKTAFVQNVATGKYMEVENASTAEGGAVQQWAYHTASHMQWIFELDGNGFFRIKSVKSGKFLGANSSNVSEVKQYGTVTDYLRWKIVETSSGNYKLVCKASTWRKSVLATPDPTSGDGVDLTIQTTYTDDSSYNDEWIIYGIMYLQYWNSDTDNVCYWSSTPTIYVYNYENSSSFYFESGVNSAKSQWSSALGIIFNHVGEDTASIKIYGVSADSYYMSTGKTWPKHVTGMTNYEDLLCGYAVHQQDIKKVSVMLWATIYILHIPESPREMDETIKTVVHEMGHALGYMGHSWTTTDVMYYAPHAQYVLSVTEKNHIAQIYSLMD